MDHADDIPILDDLKWGIARHGTDAYSARAAGDDETADRLEAVVEHLLAVLTLEENTGPDWTRIALKGLHRLPPYVQPGWFTEQLAASGQTVGDTSVDPHRLQVVGIRGEERHRRRLWHEDLIAVEVAALRHTLDDRLALPDWVTDDDLHDLGASARGRIAHHQSIIDALAYDPRRIHQ